MNGGEILQAPVPWECGGKRYMLGHTTLEVELYLQAAHQAWAANNLEAMRGRVSEFVMARHEQSLTEQFAGNRFAFGGRLSLSFLGTQVGQFEYVLLKLQKGSKEGGAQITRDELQAFQQGTRKPARGETLTPDELQAMRKADRESYRKMVAEVLARDFPFETPPEESPSPPPETPTSSTSA